MCVHMCAGLSLVRNTKGFDPQASQKWTQWQGGHCRRGCKGHDLRWLVIIPKEIYCSANRAHQRVFTVMWLPPRYITQVIGEMGMKHILVTINFLYLAIR